MPGCCSKGTGSDLELRARNAPTRRPPATPPPPSNDNQKAEGAPDPNQLGSSGDKNKSRKSNVDGGGEGEGGEGGRGPPFWKTEDLGKTRSDGKDLASHRDGDDDDDDLPLIIDAVVEEEVDEREEANSANRLRFMLCLILFLIFTIVTVIVLAFVYFLETEKDSAGVLVTKIVLPPAALHPYGPCLSNPCQNYGACFAAPDRPSNYSCTCRTGFSGQNCAKPDPCGPTDPCIPHGKCLKDDVNDSFTCFCNKGWKGERCKLVAVE